jgi:hypothetical protein
MRKDSRCCAIYHLVACLRAGKEISSRNNNVSKIISMRMRSRRASWSTISEKHGLLAVFNFSNPPSEEELHELQLGLDDDELRHSAGCDLRAQLYLQSHSCSFPFVTFWVST